MRLKYFPQIKQNSSVLLFFKSHIYTLEISLNNSTICWAQIQQAIHCSAEPSDLELVEVFKNACSCSIHPDSGTLPDNAIISPTPRQKVQAADYKVSDEKVMEG